MRKLTNLACLIAVGSLLSPAMASPSGDDWPQWMGPDRTGISMESDWSSTPASESLWRKQLGLGHSSFAISNGKLYTLGFDNEAGEDVIFCLDPETGEEIWTHRYEATLMDFAHDGGALTTPTVDGDDLYTSNREGKLFRFNAATGEVIWERDLKVELEVVPITWGFSASPLVIGDVIYMNLGKLAAIDKNSGEDIWITETNYGNAYSTPAPFSNDGRDLLALFNGNGLAVINRTDGSEIAMYEWVKSPQIYAMTPIVMDDHIFVSAGYERGCMMLKLTGNELEQLWESRVMRNKMTGSVLCDNHLYGFDESILKCIDLDGKEQWRQRGLGAGALTLAGGRLVIIDAKGEVIIAEATPDKYTELSRRKELTGGGSFWTHPVLSHGLLYCRSGKGEMSCLDFRATADVTSVSASKDQGELPTPASLFAQHVEASGGPDAFNRLNSLRFTGTNEELFNVVDSGATELLWDSQLGLRWSTETLSEFEYAMSTDMAWSIGGDEPTVILEDAGLEGIQELGDLARFLNPEEFYSSMQTTQRVNFDNRACYAVSATTSGGHARTLYFDIGTGLYAGHEGEGIPMFTFDNYQDVEGGLIPMKWSYFNTAIGAMNVATFENIELNPTLEAKAFDPPRIITLMGRTPEELEVANQEIRDQFGSILGEWLILDRGEDAPPLDGNMVLTVEDGFITFAWPGRPASPIREPDENDHMFLAGATYVQLHLNRDEEGSVIDIAVMVSGEQIARLERAETP
ncbi:MAG: PQQ-like beta-propeller repeat protein [Planctomycetota bacterium]|nr:PQQ-like beta-propeller repeat protein [Planctomycetota bacterium]